MTVLGLVLAGPLQAWGSASRFTNRGTDDAPTKSGVLGLLAAARGLRRTDPLEDLASLTFGVRIDQPGELLRDFQTARSLDGKDSMPLSHRYYRADARYVVGLEASQELLEGVAESLRNPTFPLYLGRRSCPPSEPIVPAIRDVGLAQFLHDEPWRASSWWRRRLRNDPIRVEYRIDADAWGPVLGEPAGEFTQRDEPISFDPEHRDYGWRRVRHGWVDLGGAEAPSTAPLVHDPLSFLE